MTRASKPINSIGKAIRRIRRSKGLSQEDFGVMSSRTYVSTLERGLKSPTLDKIETLAEVMQVHPLTLLVLSYLEATEPESVTASRLLEQVSSELSSVK